jgi:hypothetical protein
MYCNIFIAVPFSGDVRSVGCREMKAEEDVTHEVSASLSSISVSLALAA